MSVTESRIPEPFTPVFVGLDDIGTGGIMDAFVWKEVHTMRAYVYCQLGTGFSISGPIQMLMPHAVQMYRTDFGNPTEEGSDPILGTVMAQARTQPQFRSYGPVLLVNNDRLGLYTQRLEQIDGSTPGNWKAGGWFQISVYGPTRELIQG